MRILKLILGVLVSTMIATSCQNEALDDSITASYENHLDYVMNQVGSSNIYEFTTYLSKGQSGAYYYLNDTVWTAKETIPESCQLKWGNRLYEVSTTSTAQTITNTWSGE